MNVLMWRGLLRAARTPGGGPWPGLQQQAAATSRLLSAAAGEGGAGGAEGADGSQGPGQTVYDAAAEGLPVRVHQLIGDPRTGVADDTTQPLHGDLAVEWIWSQEKTGTDWYRYSLAGRDQLPNMHMDARLSDHSKNLMYLLRCKDPQRWSIEALATKFRIRRQRVLAILALKEIEAQGIEDGRLMAGPFSPFAFCVDLEDFLVDDLGEPLDLGDLVHSPDAAAAAAAAAREQRARRQQRGASKHARGASAGAAAGGDGLGSLADFIESGEEASDGGGGGGELDALTQLQLAASGREHDLALVMPRAAAAAQRAHLQLLRLLRRCGYSAAGLRAQLLAQVDAAEAAWAEHVAGGPLEAALIAAAREHEAAAGGGGAGADAAAPAAAAEGQEQEQGGGGEGEQQEGGGGGGGAGLPQCLDFAWQRSQVEALVSALAPLMDLAGAPAEREAARLAAQLRGELEPLLAQQHQQPGTASDAAGDSSSGDGSSSSSSSTGGAGSASLQALVAAADPAALAAAFNLLELDQRRALLAAAPEAKVSLNVRGADLRAAAAGAAAHTPAAAAVGEIGPAAGGGAGGGAGLEQLPDWPGQAARLVDAFGFEDIPAGALAAALAALRPLEAAVAALDAVLAAAAAQGEGAGGGASTAAAAGCGEVEAVQEAARTYSTLLWAYDKVLDAQTAEVQGAEHGAEPGAPPPPPPSAQRRLMRILRELDPRALEKLLYWESWERELREDPRRAAALRAKIQRVINAMNERAAGGEPAGGDGGAEGAPGASGGGGDEYPEIEQLRDPAKDLARRLSHDLVAAFVDAVVVGRQYHRGSGERHFVRLDSYPKFEGYSLDEFDKVREGELSLLSRRVAERQDDMMWREFRARLHYNLGLAGTGLYDTHGRAKPQRPEEGWSWVVHDTSRHWNSKRERRRQQQQQQQQQQPGRGGPVPYVAEASGRLRQLQEEEAYLQRRRTPQSRRRWFVQNRRLGTG